MVDCDLAALWFSNDIVKQEISSGKIGVGQCVVMKILIIYNAMQIRFRILNH